MANLTTIDIKKVTKALRQHGGKGSGHFGHKGRPGHVGGSAPSGAAGKTSGATAISPQEKRFDFFNKRTETALELAKKVGIPQDKFEVSKEIGPMSPAGRVLAQYDPQTDNVILYGNALYQDDTAIEGILAHEYNHMQISKVPGRELDAKFDEMMSQYGYDNRIEFTNFMAREADDISNYTRDMWDLAREGEISPSLAAIETLAEIARVRSTERGSFERLSEVWKLLYEQIFSEADTFAEEKMIASHLKQTKDIVIYLDSKFRVVPFEKAAMAKVLPASGAPSYFTNPGAPEQWTGNLEEIVNVLRQHGGAGSGNFGHKGRPGEVGGSAPSGAGAAGVGMSEREMAVRKMAKEIGIPDDIFKIDQLGEDKKTIGGDISGQFRPQEGAIYLDVDFLNQPDELIRGVLSHEYTHYQMHKVPTRELSNAFRETGKEFGYMTDKESALAFAKSGSITDYTGALWLDVIFGDTPFTLALEETVADVAFLRATNKGGEVPVMWDSVYEKIITKAKSISQNVRMDIEKKGGDIIIYLDENFKWVQSKEEAVIAKVIPTDGTPPYFVYIRKPSGLEKTAEVLRKHGGAGSGHFDHKGRPGERGGSQPSGAGFVTDKKQIIQYMADAYGEKWGFDAKHPRDKYVERLEKDMKDASPGYIEKVREGVLLAVQKYGAPSIPVLIRGQRQGYNDRWSEAVYSQMGGHIEFIEQDKYLETPQVLGDAPSSISATFDNQFTGTYIHEVGHAVYYKNKSVRSRASAVDLDSKEMRTWLKKNISRYSIENDRELAAECYAMTLHPDYVKLPAETRKFVEGILQGYKLNALERIINVLRTHGGAGSGHFDHKGRPGKRGGSAPSGAAGSKAGTTSSKDKQAVLDRVSKKLQKGEVRYPIEYYESPSDVPNREGRQAIPEHAGAAWDESNKKIYVFESAFRSGKSIEGVIAHELTHTIVDRMEQKELYAIGEKLLGEDWVGSLMVQATMTDYAKSVWTQYMFGDAPQTRAIRESLAEVAFTKAAHPEQKIPEVWDNYYSEVLKVATTPKPSKKSTMPADLRAILEAELKSRKHSKIINVLRTHGGKGSGHHGHKGRPGERGGSAPGTGSSIQWGGIYSSIEKAAKMFNFPINKIKYHAAEKTFKIGERELKYGGSYNPDSDEITIYHAEGWKQDAMNAVMAHEVMHSKLDEHLAKHKKELEIISEPWRQSDREKYIAWESGKLKPEYVGKFPHYEWERKWFIENSKSLKMFDGVTQYSSYYWEEYGFSGRAFEETMAEIAKLDYQGRLSEVKAPWRECYNEFINLP